MNQTSTVTLAVLMVAISGCSSSRVQSADNVDEGTMRAFRHNRSVEMTPGIEEDLAKWMPDHTNLAALISAILKPGMNVAGEWAADDSTMTITASQKETYSIAFSTGGCLGDWDLPRTGRYSDGILRLSQPVQEYCPFTYDTLYAVAVGGCDYLISQSGIRFISEHYTTNGVVDWAEHIEDAAFHRKINDGTQPTSSHERPPEIVRYYDQWIGCKAPPIQFDQSDRVQYAESSYKGKRVLLYSFDAGNFCNAPKMPALLNQLTTLQRARGASSEPLYVIG